MKQKILLADDDSREVPAVKEAFENHGFHVKHARDGDAALLAFEEEDFDAVLLESLIPRVDGIDVCRRIRRESDIPIAVLSESDNSLDAVLTLEAGADDYVRKPFDPIELVARVRALLRRVDSRTGGEHVSVDGGEVVSVGSIAIHPRAFKVFKKDTEIHLSSTEFRLLLELARRPGRAFTRELLLNLVWGYDYVGESRVVDVTVKRLRDKIEDNPKSPRLINTVRGVGYRLEPVQANRPSV